MVAHMISHAPPPPTDAEKIEASARYVAEGEARERGSEQLRSEASARAHAQATEQRRAAAGG
jgi:hypothetical protein